VISAELGAAGNLPIDVLVTSTVACDQGCKQLPPLGPSVRILHPDFGEAVGQPCGVRFEAEGPPGINGHELVDTIAIEKATVERGDPCLA